MNVNIALHLKLSEKLYEQLIQDCMHLFSVHVDIIFVLASILWQVRDQISEPQFRPCASLVKGPCVQLSSSGCVSGVHGCLADVSREIGAFEE